MKYQCPACQKPFDKAIKSHCPLCNTQLVSKRAVKEGKLTFWYELPLNMTQRIPKELLGVEKGQDITVIKESPERLSSKYPIRLTEPGQLPVVIQSGDNEFDVYFQHMMYTGMVYCPKCQSPAFQNMQLFGDLEHWCSEKDTQNDGKPCKARTTYHFNDPNGVEVN